MIKESTKSIIFQTDFKLKSYIENVKASLTEVLENDQSSLLENFQGPTYLTQNESKDFDTQTIHWSHELLKICFGINMRSNIWRIYAWAGIVGKGGTSFEGV